MTAYIFEDNDRWEERTTEGAQRRALEAYARQQAWSIGRTFVDRGDSTDSPSRPAFLRMVGQIAQGAIRHLLVSHYDRITTNIGGFIVFLAYLKRHHVRLSVVFSPERDSPAYQRQIQRHCDLRLTRR
jgi:DNA invertase Pin-like site-specific DNA recombinase